MTKLNYYVLAICFAALSLSVSAQTVKGKVKDKKTGATVPDAIMLLKKNGKSYTSQVKPDGSYSFANIEEGEYTLVAKLIGYKTEVLPEINATKDKVIVLDLELEDNSVELDDVTVKNFADKESDSYARKIEKNAEVTMNVLSAKAIELSPDITVANSIQRISGITIEKSSTGEGRYPIIRGMEKRYINTLVNGIKIPSPDNKNRFIPLDLFPSELLERLEVSKSLIPSMEGDAIGGTINLVMKDAPQKKLFSINASTGYSLIFSDQPYMNFAHAGISKQSPNEINGRNYVATPADFSVTSLNLNNYSAQSTPLNTTMGITYGNRFGKNKKFGVIVAGSYQNTCRGTSSIFFLPNAQPGLNNEPEFSDLYSRTYSTQSQRIGLNAKMDYQFNNRNKISLVNTYVRLDDYMVRVMNDTIALNSLLDQSVRTTWQYQSIYNTTLQGLHNLTSSVKFDWSLVYSIANNHKPNESEFTHEFPLAQPAQDKVQSISHAWSHNSDKDYSVYLNITKNTQLFKRNLELKFGGVIRDKTRDNLYNSYSLTPVLSSTGANQLFTTINNAVFTFKGAGASLPDINNVNNYTFNETITAGYAQGKLQLSDKLEALGGVRVEHTHQHYETMLDSSAPYISGSIWYTDVLPSLQFKYQLTNSQLLRLSYYKALARPGFAEMIPGGPGSFETFKQVGDPANLNHTTADNFDFRYEYFTKKADQLLLGVFYKNIQDPIEYAVEPSGATSQNLKTKNFGNAYNFGFEALVKKYFGNFGVSASYTFTQSQITTTKSLIYRDSTSGQIKTNTAISDTRPLQGQSKHIGSVTAMYKNAKIGLDIQVAFAYTGDRIAIVNPNYGLDYWETPSSQLDISFEKRIVNKLSFFGKLNNLTNTPYTLELNKSYNAYLHPNGSGSSRSLPIQTDPNNKIFVQKDIYKGSYLFGVRYKF